MQKLDFVRWLAEEPKCRQYANTQHLLITENWENKTHEGANNTDRENKD